jgi:DNA sulfur modification protein DndD
MILQKLSLFNFCLYAGEQEFDLAPTKVYGKHRPVVLCGGINGGGKTTLLDAVQLALYGNRARTSKRSNQPYDDFLRECIHRGVPASDGASISLSFRYASEGKDHLYEVTRRWSEKGAGIKEHLSVFKNEQPDPWLSDNWNTVVEELIPLGVSQLFFFDAEQIRFLAEDDTSNEALSGAIKSLLGLDLAERLIADAKVVESRLAKETTADPEKKKKLEKLESEIYAREDDRHKAKQNKATLEGELLRANKESKKAELAFASAGGKQWKKREKLAAEKLGVRENVDRCEDQLMRLAESGLPLLMLQDLLGDVAKQDEKEQIAKSAELLTKTLQKRDKKVLAAMKKAKLSAAKLKVLDEYLAEDRGERKSKTSKKKVEIHKLSDSARSLMTGLMGKSGSEQKKNAQKLVAELDSIKLKLDTIERSLAAAPKEDSLKVVAANLKDANSAAAIAGDRISRIDKELSSIEFDLANLRRDYNRICRDQIESDLANEESRRLGELSKKTQEIMAQFLDRATSAKIDRLSAFVTESFRFLLRKKELVERIEIDPSDFSITLFDTEGEPIQKSRLSEGEKQIFAISVLWGLARASTRPLPAIIDTPMARLDETHRSHLIERYFPNASHQVIILSTDTEIDGEYYESLAPNIARSYFLNYNEKKRHTSVEEGYFKPRPSKSKKRGVSA